MSGHSLRAPTVTAARKCGVIRVDLNLLENSRVARLTDAEWRAYISLLPWVARNCENADGEIPASWLDSFWFGTTASGRPRRLTPKLLARLLELGLLEEWEYDDGTSSIVVVGWRDFRPVDLTSAERKRRWRRKLYGDLYYGTEGDVMQVRLPDAEDRAEVERLEALGRAAMKEVERRGVVAVLAELGTHGPGEGAGQAERGSHVPSTRPVSRSEASE